MKIGVSFAPRHSLSAHPRSLRSEIKSSQSQQIMPHGRKISNPATTTSLFDRAQWVPWLRDG